MAASFWRQATLGEMSCAVSVVMAKFSTQKTSATAVRPTQTAATSQGRAVLRRTSQEIGFKQEPQRSGAGQAPMRAC